MIKIKDYLVFSLKAMTFLILGIILIKFPQFIKFVSGTALNLDEIVKNGWNTIVGWSFIGISILIFGINFYRIRKICIIKIDGLRGHKLKEERIWSISRQYFENYNVNVGREGKAELVEALNKLVYKFEFYKEKGIEFDLYCFSGISYTPFIFMLGCLYGDDNKKYRFYHYKRKKPSTSKRIRLWPSLRKVERLEFNHTQKNSNELVVQVSTSLNIGALKDKQFDDFDIMEFKAVNCGFDSITSQKTLNLWAQQIIQEIRKHRDKYTKIHLLLSTSTAMTFLLGTALNNNYDKEIYVYHYEATSKVNYCWAICPKKEKNIDKIYISKEK